MMLDLAALPDMTARSIQSHDERRGCEETYVNERPVRSFEETVFLVYRSSVPSMRGSGSLTPTKAETLGALGVNTRRPSAPSHDDTADRARDARVVLLARKYEGISTTEDEARIEILTQRLRRLSPRVTPKDLDQLTLMVGQLEEVSSNLDEIRSKFGLK
jgi:hypothetical protein